MAKEINCEIINAKIVKSRLETATAALGRCTRASKAFVELGDVEATNLCEQLVKRAEQHRKAALAERVQLFLDTED